MTAASHRPGTRPLPTGPFVLPRSRYDELFDTTAALLALVRRAVLALAPTWPERLVALGADPADHPPHSGLEAAETEHCALLAGADFLVDETGPRLVGLDPDGALGSARRTGMLTSARLHTHTRPQDGPLFGHDPRAVRAEALAEVCAHRGLPRTVALIGPGFHPQDVHDLTEHGFAADLLAPTDLPGALGRPGGLRYALGLLGSTRRATGTDLGPLRDTQRAGMLLLPPLSSGLLADKRALALVSEGLPWMTRGERALVERGLPWTRITLAGRTRWHDGERELPGLLLTERERFVLKPAVAGAGPVLVGHRTDESTWAAAVRRAFGQGDSVVQEHIRPAPYPLRMGDGTGTWTVPAAPVLSPVLFAGRPGGCRVRYLTPAGGSLPADAVLARQGLSRRAAPSAAPRCR
ncbi:hypothetical protein JW613_06940 [Streptomyces smyrnaeus]|uniref:Circularly permuted type 2 ATP-grasp protein n=1 Tax=Streptomyces smyrnaeus TaxID=1387713 RepID=A0ABS3XRV9_9ACTN|nr:hypothetical protein [Streptomyces smyrnaeus]MBO8198038.1 hypothetical protein [Streptomyces smyrnaeus]